MDAKEISTKVQKIVKMYKDWLINGVYFNPMYARDLYKKADELAEIGITVDLTHTETELGSVVSAEFSSPHSKLDLGSVLLDGKTVTVPRKLSTIDNLVRFIETEAEKYKTDQEDEG